MTNTEIIFKDSIAEGIFTKEEAVAIIKSGRDLPIHTYADWKTRGYQVKTGEHAAMVSMLWKFCKKKVEVNNEEREIESAYRFKAHLFTAAQVEKAETRTIKTAEEIRAYNKMLAEQRRARATA